MFGLLDRTLSNESHRKRSQRGLLKITRAIYLTSLKSRMGTSFRHPDKVMRAFILWAVSFITLFSSWLSLGSGQKQPQAVPGYLVLTAPNTRREGGIWPMCEYLPGETPGLSGCLALTDEKMLSSCPCQGHPTSQHPCGENTLPPTTTPESKGTADPSFQSHSVEGFAPACGRRDPTRL